MTDVPQSPIPALAREVNLREATALNIIDMIGVGPFVTIPLIIHAMHGPQAMLGWVLGAGLAMCDGLVWAELGASHAAGRRLIPISKRKLRREAAGAADVIPVRLAVDLQRAALDRLRLPGHCPLRGICLAVTEPRAGGAHRVFGTVGARLSPVPPVYYPQHISGDGKLPARLWLLYRRVR